MAVEMLRKRFDECVLEIKEYETKLVEPKATEPEAPSGQYVETTTMSYGEALAEIKRIKLIKRMSSKLR